MFIRITSLDRSPRRDYYNLFKPGGGVGRLKEVQRLRALAYRFLGLFVGLLDRPVIILLMGTLEHGRTGDEPEGGGNSTGGAHLRNTRHRIRIDR